MHIKEIKKWIYVILVDMDLVLKACSKNTYVLDFHPYWKYVYQHFWKYTFLKKYLWVLQSESERGDVFCLNFIYFPRITNST